MMIIDVSTMEVTGNVDLLDQGLMRSDIYSQHLKQHGAVADTYNAGFLSYKSKLFTLVRTIPLMVWG
jgi:hypothetical protein